MINLKCSVISFFGLSFIGYEIFVIFSPPNLPTVDEDIWWAVGERPEQENTSVREFTIKVNNEIITDLKARLKNHRLVAPYIEGSANKYGTNLLLLKSIVQFWTNEYNWTARQEFLNKYPQYITNVLGLDIHFIHIKPTYHPKKKIRPLLFLHGWPGSVREFYETIEILQNGNQKFDLELIVPSLPGYGFSQGSSKSGFSLIQVAIIMKKLMMRLNHEKFYVQGGDLGALTLQILSILYPESVLGFHTNFPVVYTIKSYLKPILGIICPFCFVKPQHYDRVYPLVDKGMFVFRESGYLHIQSTKPDSIGAAMEDSPTGLAAYFLEKFIVGSNFSWVEEFDIVTFKQKFDYTSIIDNLMYYWITGSVTTAFRLYYETFGDTLWSESFTILRTPVKVPTIIFRSKYDLYMADGVLDEIYPMLLNLTDHDTGHFPALENPHEFSLDIFRSIEVFEHFAYRQEFLKLHLYYPAN